MRCLIVEDEPLARQKLLDLLDGVSWIDGVRIAKTLAEGRAECRREAFDLIFLDVRLPDGRGLALLADLPPTTLVVFTTAFDEYAVTAFELQALDYLVKPFSAQRFSSTLERIRRASPSAAATLTARAGAADSATPPTRIFARAGNDLIPLDVADVERIDGFDDHAAVWVENRRHLVFRRLKDLEAVLAPLGFIRVHRSHLINVAHVALLKRLPDGRVTIVMTSGAKVVASKARAAALRQTLGV